MIAFDQARAEGEFFLCLALLHIPASPGGLAQVAGLGVADALSRLRALEEQGLVRCHALENDRWSVTDDAARDYLVTRADFLVRPGESPFADGVRQLRAGKWLEGGDAIHEAAVGQMWRGNSAGALVCLDILVDALREWDPAQRTDEENTRYLDLVHEVAGACLFLTSPRERLLDVLEIAFAVAGTLGNSRASILLRLMQISMHYLVGGVMQGEPHAALEEIAGEIEALGDDDIREGTAHGLSLQYYSRGEFARCIAFLRDNLPDGDSRERRFYSGVALSIVVFSACRLGRFGNAIGALLHYLDVCSTHGMKVAFRRAKVLSADVLLSAGFPDAAMEIASDAIACGDTSAESYVVSRGYRVLAFYHFIRGNLAASRAMLCECLRVSAQYRLQQPFLGFHDVLEMLWAYKEHGLPEIPDCTLEDELVAALNGNNAHRQGIALRVRARQFMNEPYGYTLAVPLLEGSRQLFVQGECPIDYARSGLVLAACLRETGSPGEADAVFEESRNILKQFRQPDCPPPLPETAGMDEGPLAEPGGSRADNRDSAKPQAVQCEHDGAQCARHCVEQFARIPERLPFASRLQWVMDTMRDALSVERVALFAVGEGHAFTCLAARDFSQADRDSGLASTHALRMARCVSEGKPLLWRSRYGACLCLPVKISANYICVFFAHCAYLVHSIMEHDPAYFEPVQRVLEEELRLAFLVERTSSAVQDEELRRSRLVAERMQEGGGLYYGPSMRKILESADRAAPTGAAVLLLGETGVGKEELARRIHHNSGRPGPFVAVNLASIPEQLFESELFGHEKGAFTGALLRRIGLVELADKGTLFIDEVGEIPQALQVKLLRVLHDARFTRVGGSRELHSDFRLVAATNQDLRERIKEGGFREDLYYRISVVPLYIPPLRERPEDIRHLARLFHTRFAATYKRIVPPLTEAELDELATLRWPGNVRELKSFIERGVILYDARKSTAFLQEALPEKNTADGAPVAILPGGGTPAAVGPHAPGAAQIGPSPEPAGPDLCHDLPTMEELQRRYIRHVLTLTRGKVRGPDGALAILDMKQSSFYKKLKEYGLDKTSQLYGRGED